MRVLETTFEFRYFFKDELLTTVANNFNDVFQMC